MQERSEKTVQGRADLRDRADAEPDVRLGPADPARSFLEWAQQARIPLCPVSPGAPSHDLTLLGERIGAATVVALGEGTHCAAEPLEFRNRLFQFLVEEKGFTAIALESGIVESRLVYEYVRGGSGDLHAVASQGLGWTFDDLPQNLALIRWLRQYNEDPRYGRQINFYGFDVPGSPASRQARRGHDTALTEALEYLGRVDTSIACTALRARIGALARRLKLGIGVAGGEETYESLSQSERDALTASIADLILLLERQEGRYIVVSSIHEYEWAYRAAVGARQMDNWLRQVPLGWRSHNNMAFTDEDAMSLFAAADVRDRAQADNIEWILRREGSDGKILVFAHHSHLSNAPVQWLLDDEAPEHQAAGTYLRRRLGAKIVTIGNLIGGGQVGCTSYRATLKRPPPDSLVGLAGAVGEPLFLLDLRAAPAIVTRWLNQAHGFAHGTLMLKMAVAEAFDILLYVDAVSPACENEP